MSRSKGTPFILKFLLTFIIVIVMLATVLGIAGGILITRTPRELGLQDVVIGSKTIEEMGLADTQFIEIIKSFRAVANAKEEDIVTNGYSEEEEKTKSSENFGNSSLDDTDDYSAVLTGKVTYDNRYLVVYSDGTLGYVINNAIQNYSGGESSVKFMQDANISLVELTVTKDETQASIRSVCKMDISAYSQQVKDKLGVLASVLTVPSNIYVVSEINVTISETGKLVTSSKNINVNGRDDDVVIEAIVSVFLENMSGVNSLEDVNAKLGEAISDIVYNLGAVGTATVDSNNVVTGTIVYSDAGIRNHELSLITHVA